MVPTLGALRSVGSAAAHEAVATAERRPWLAAAERQQAACRCARLTWQAARRAMSIGAHLPHRPVLRGQSLPPGEGGLHRDGPRVICLLSLLPETDRASA
eukprot:scaffold12921_cov87-Isochrysis_galbana.AAC.4